LHAAAAEPGFAEDAHLRAVGEALGLPGLRELVVDVIRRSTARRPSIACVTLAASGRFRRAFRFFQRPGGVAGIVERSGSRPTTSAAMQGQQDAELGDLISGPGEKPASR
jgi:hypothetical protein